MKSMTSPGARQAASRPDLAPLYRRHSNRDEVMTLEDATVLADGVVVDARAVSFAVRMLSGLIDALAVYALAMMLLTATGSMGALGGSASSSATTATILGIVVLCLVVAPVTLETLTRGRSIGKIVMGVRIVRDDGGPIRFRQALVRGLLGVLELWMTAGGLAILVSFVNHRGKRLGDVMAGTYPMRVRSGGVRRAPLTTPAPLAGWAHTADIRPLPDAMALAARQLLARAPRLDPSSRHRMASELAAALEPFVAPNPPQGTAPEAFLAAVLAERRDRELTRARVDEQRAEEQRQAMRHLPWGLGERTAPARRS